MFQKAAHHIDFAIGGKSTHHLLPLGSEIDA
jgi:hypothetical protein